MGTSMATNKLESQILEVNQPQSIGKAAVNQYKMFNESSGQMSKPFNINMKEPSANIPQSSMDTVFPGGKYDISYSAPSHL